MATSGTVSTTTFNTRKLLDHAYRRCKLSNQAITSELLDNGLSSLYLVLSSLPAELIPLWTIETVLMGMTQGNPSLPLPVGTVDVLNANVRTMNRVTGTYSSTSGTAGNAFDGDIATVCTEVAPAGNIILDTGAGDEAGVTTVGIMPGASGTWTFTLSFSDDGVTYNTYATETAVTVVNGEWLWYDVVTDGAVHQYWKITAGASTTLVVRELYYGNTPTEIPMGVLNRDNYYTMPNKTMQSLPLQYWLDKGSSVVTMRVWPAPSSAEVFKLVSAQRRRYIEDVGTLRQEIEVPQRWYDAIIWKVAEVLACETPEVDTDKVLPAIQAMGKRAWDIAVASEHTEDAIQLQLNISQYTRC